MSRKSPDKITPEAILRVQLRVVDFLIDPDKFFDLEAGLYDYNAEEQESGGAGLDPNAFKAARARFIEFVYEEGAGQLGHYGSENPRYNVTSGILNYFTANPAVHVRTVRRFFSENPRLCIILWGRLNKICAIDGIDPDVADAFGRLLIDRKFAKQKVRCDHIAQAIADHVNDKEHS